MKYAFQINYFENSEIEIISRDADFHFRMALDDMPEEEILTADAIELVQFFFPLALHTEYRKKGLAIPMPTPAQDNDVEVDFPAEMEMKILLWNAMLEQDVKVGKLAKKLCMKKRKARRLVSFKEFGKPGKLKKALKALGVQYSMPEPAPVEAGDDGITDVVEVKVKAKK